MGQDGEWRPVEELDRESEKVLKNYVGQERIKDIVRIHIHHYNIWGGALPHMILFGNAGLGKTTFAQTVAKATRSDISFYTGGGISGIKEARKIIFAISEGDFVFIDETHAMPRKSEEEFYSVMQDFYVATENGKEDIPKFTLIGATTSAGMLSKPFLDRFRLHLNVDPYTEEELSKIVQKEHCLDKKISEEIAKRSMGVPRIALGLAETIRKAEYRYDEVFELLRVDALGLQENHRLILKYLKDIERPVGVQSIAYGCDISQHDLVNIYERDLLKLGFIARTPRGRMITEKGKLYIKGEI